jgi:chorismate mutase
MKESIIKELAALRSEIDDQDHRLIQILAKRRDLARRIMQVKIAEGRAFRDDDRVREIVETRTSWAKKENLDTDFIAELFQSLMDGNIKFEEEKLQKRHGN